VFALFALVHSRELAVHGGGPGRGSKSCRQKQFLLASKHPLLHHENADGFFNGDLLSRNASAHTSKPPPFPYQIHTSELDLARQSQPLPEVIPSHNFQRDNGPAAYALYCRLYIRLKLGIPAVV
jgi:hypothetical protein